MGNTARADRLGLQLNVVAGLTPLVYTRYPPSLSFVLSGRKRSVVGDHDQTWGTESFLITPVDLPVIARVVETGASGDFVSANWRLDPVLVAELAGRVPRSPASNAGERLGAMNDHIAGSIDRLFALLDAPEEIPALLPLVSRELVFRLLQTDQGRRLLAVAESTRADVVADTIATLSMRLAEPWTLDRIAAEAGVSPATLARRFRQVTEMTPMQYLKRLRLGEARRRILVLGETVSFASTAVGYASAAHFSRDYRAAYEVTAASDAARRKED